MDGLTPPERPTLPPVLPIALPAPGYLPPAPLHGLDLADAAACDAVRRLVRKPLLTDADDAGRLRAATWLHHHCAARSPSILAVPDLVRLVWLAARRLLDVSAVAATPAGQPVQARARVCSWLCVDFCLVLGLRGRSALAAFLACGAAPPDDALEVLGLHRRRRSGG